MPQHPRYTNSPSRNLDKLFELLNQLEGFGLVVLESLSCGTPVLASNIGGLGELVSEKT